MTALGMAVLIGAAGCMRTSDGSYVMRKPVALSRFLGLGKTNAPAYTAQPNEPRYFPPQRSAASPPVRHVKFTAPSLSLAPNPPFKRSKSAKPLSCRNEATRSGRIRVVSG